MITKLEQYVLDTAPDNATHYIVYNGVQEVSILKLNPTNFWFAEISKWVCAEPHSITNNMHKLALISDLRKKQVALADIKPKPKPLTNVEYVKVEFSKLSEAFAVHEKEHLHCRSLDKYYECQDLNVLAAFNCNDNIYRKVEKEITWQESLKEMVIESHGERLWDRVKDFIEDEPDVFQDICSIVTSMTDKPE